MLGGGQGLLRVGEGLLETMLIKHIFATATYRRQGRSPARSAGEGVRNPNTAEDPAGPCSEQVYVPWVLVRGQRPYHQLPPLGMGTRGQVGQSFPPLLKDGDAAPQPSRPPGPWGSHRDIKERSPHHPRSASPARAGDSQKCRSPFFPLQWKTKGTALASLTAYELAAGPRELQGHHLMAERFLHPRRCWG